MNPRFSKPLFMGSIVIAIAALIVSIFLFLALRHARQQSEVWKAAHEQTVREQLLLKQQLKELSTTMPHRGGASDPELPVVQQDQATTLAHAARQLLNAPLEQNLETSAMHQEVYPEALGDLFAEVLAADFPELELKQDELQELSEAVTRFRESTNDLRLIQRSSNNAETINNLMEQRDQAMLDFERISGMSIIEFMRRAPADNGIDRD